MGNGHSKPKKKARRERAGFLVAQRIGKTALLLHFLLGPARHQIVGGIYVVIHIIPPTITIEVEGGSLFSSRLGEENEKISIIHHSILIDVNVGWGGTGNRRVNHPLSFDDSECRLNYSDHWYGLYHPAIITLFLQRLETGPPQGKVWRMISVSGQINQDFHGIFAISDANGRFLFDRSGNGLVEQSHKSL